MNNNNPYTSSQSFHFEVFSSKEEIFMAIANDMIDLIKHNNALDKHTLLIVPVGPVGHYAYVVKRVIKENISLRKVTFINMDEYMINQETWIDYHHLLSFRRYMDEHFYHMIPEALNVPSAQRLFPDPSHVEHIMQVIEAHGGVDACYGGIGLNGHVAFNEPVPNLSKKKFRNLTTRVVKIAPETRVTNAINELDGAYYHLPKYAITIGFKEILSSKKIRLYAFRPWHKSVIQRLAFGVDSTEFPVSLLNQHQDVRIGLTQDILPKEMQSHEHKPGV